MLLKKFLLKTSACNFIKKETLPHRCFPVNFAKFLRITFFGVRKNTSGKIAPRKMAPGKMPPRKVPPQKNDPEKLFC